MRTLTEIRAELTGALEALDRLAALCPAWFDEPAPVIGGSSTGTTGMVKPAEPSTRSPAKRKATRRAARKEPSAAGAPKGSLRDKIRQCIMDGPSEFTAPSISSRCGGRTQGVSDYLAKLANAGEIERVSHGQYRRTATVHRPREIKAHEAVAAAYSGLAEELHKPHAVSHDQG